MIREMLSSLADDINYRQNNPLRFGSVVAGAGIAGGAGLYKGGQSLVRKIKGTDSPLVRAHESLKPKTAREETKQQELEDASSKVIRAQKGFKTPLHTIVGTRLNTKIDEGLKLRMQEQLIKDVQRSKPFKSIMSFNSKGKKPVQLDMSDSDSMNNNLTELPKNLMEETSVLYDEIAKRFSALPKTPAGKVRRSIEMGMVQNKANNYILAMQRQIAKGINHAGYKVNIQMLPLYLEDIGASKTPYDIWTVAKSLNEKGRSLIRHVNSMEAGKVFIEASHRVRDLIGEFSGSEKDLEQLKYANRLFKGLSEIDEVLSTGDVLNGTASNRILRLISSSERAKAWKLVDDLIGIDYYDSYGNVRHDLSAQQKAERMYTDAVINETLNNSLISDPQDVYNKLRNIQNKRGVGGSEEYKALMTLLKNFQDIRTLKSEEFIQDVDFYNSKLTKTMNALNEVTGGLFPRRALFFSEKEKPESMLDIEEYLENLLEYDVPVEDRLANFGAIPEVQYAYKISEEDIVSEVQQQRIGAPKETQLIEHKPYYYLFEKGRENINSIMNRPYLTIEEQLAISKAKSDGLFNTYMKNLKDLDDVVRASYFEGKRVLSRRVPIIVNEFFKNPITDLSKENEKFLSEFGAWINQAPVLRAIHVAETMQESHTAFTKLSDIDKKYSILIDALSKVPASKYQDIDKLINALEKHKQYSKYQIINQRRLRTAVKDVTYNFMKEVPQNYNNNITKYISDFVSWDNKTNKPLNPDDFNDENLDEQTKIELLKRLLRFNQFLRGKNP